MSTREIITLQIGHYSSFIGTHWWNLQQSAFDYGSSDSNSDILFREGKNLHGEITYTPRLMIIDKKNSLNSLKQGGSLYNVVGQKSNSSQMWSGHVITETSAPSVKNEFLKDLDKCEPDYSEINSSKKQRLEDGDVECELNVDPPESSAAATFSGKKLYDLNDSVCVWSDYLRLHLHPKTMHVMSKYLHNSEVDSFDIFGEGKSYCNEWANRSDLEDRLHFFAEECDNLQGFHILTDPYDAFGGLSVSVAQELADEFSNKCIFTTANTPSSVTESPLHAAYKLLNTTLSYERLIDYSSAFLPMSVSSGFGLKPGVPRAFPHLVYNSVLNYHTAAILSLCLDTCTLPYRLHSSSTSMAQLVGQLTSISGRKVLSAQLCSPFPIYSDNSLLDTLLDLGDTYPWQTLLPCGEQNSIPTVQSIVLRGITSEKLTSNSARSREAMQQLGRCSNANQILLRYFRDVFPNSVHLVNSSAQPLKVETPFPHIFSSLVSSSGFLSSNERPRFVGVDSIPVMSLLQSSPDVRNLLQTMLAQLEKINFKTFSKFIESGIEEDEYREAVNNLKSVAESYEDDMGNMV